MNPVRLSKLLSRVLRHRPADISLDLDREGWANVGELLDCLRRSGKQVTRAELAQVVADNNKQRFRFSDDGLRIRANQGHSIDVDLGLEPLPPPETLFHGTATRNLDSIRQRGLLKSGRHHVHLSADTTTAVAVGSRHGKPVVLTVDSGAMHRAGHAFFLSANGVWLTDCVPPDFIGDGQELAS